MSKKNKHTKAGILILIIFHAVGLVGFSLPQFTPLFKQLVPYHLLLSLAVLLYFHKPYSVRFVASMLAIMLAGWSVEWVGVETGKIFGLYHYGATLGYKVWQVPLMIGVNWFILLYCSFALSEKITNAPLLKYLLTAVFMVLMDVLIEPVAIKFDYWQWHTMHIPLQNYIAWAIVGFIMAIAWGSAKMKQQNSIAVALYTIQLVFFMISNVLL